MHTGSSWDFAFCFCEANHSLGNPSNYLFQSVFANDPMAVLVVHLRGYAKRQKIMAILVVGMFLEIYLTPQTLGGGEFISEHTW